MANKRLKNFTIVMLIATAFLLISLLSSCSVHFLGGGKIDLGTYANADKYVAGNKVYSEKIDSLHINWSCGELTVKENAEGKISVTESGKDLSDDEKVHSAIIDGKLMIQFWASGRSGIISDDSKKLTVEIPSGLDVKISNSSAKIICGELNCKKADISTSSGSVNIEKIVADEVEIDSSSGSVNITALSSRKAEIESSSGRITVNEAIADELSVESTSGRIEIGKLEASISDVESSSGSITITFGEKCEKLDVESSSGDVTLVMGSGGATVKVDAFSGKVYTALNYTSSPSGMQFGDGKCSVKVKTSSGDIIIK